MKLLPTVAVAVLAVLAGCSSDSSTQVVPSSDQLTNSPFAQNETASSVADDQAMESGGAIEDSNAFKGEMGFIVDARQIKRQGYTPRTAVVTIKDEYQTSESTEKIEYTSTVQLGEHSFMGTYKLNKADLSPEVIRALNNGADVYISLYESEYVDEQSPLVEDYKISRVVMQANPKPLTISAHSVDVDNVKLTLSPDTKYFIEQVNWKGDPTGHGLTWQSTPSRNLFIHKSGIPLQNAQSTAAQKWQFRFHPIPGEPNTFAIQYEDTKQFLRLSRNFYHFNDGHPATHGRWSRAGKHNALRLANEKELQAALDYWGSGVKFKVEKVADGVFKLISVGTGTALRRIQGDAQYGDGH
ncbi:MAG: hypothetical protein KTR32_43675, partial [Granulosicoccus sp.]|nr:hypothetical protein [Granulosicoccus sp.]